MHYITDFHFNAVNTKICIIFVQYLTNDIGPTLYRCYTNVLCLLGM